LIVSHVVRAHEIRPRRTEIDEKLKRRTGFSDCRRRAEAHARLANLVVLHGKSIDDAIALLAEALAGV
jgi:hypothetical protein